MNKGSTMYIQYFVKEYEIYFMRDANILYFKSVKQK